jgi:hypothetical protein
MSNAGKMGAGATWGIALAGSAVGAAAGGFIPGIVGWLVALAIIGGAGWATVHMTQASAGKGILAFLAGGAVSAIVTYFVYKMQISSAMADASAEIAKNAKSTGNAQLDAQLAQAGTAMASGLAGAAAVTGAVLSLIRTFIVGMVGCFIGGATKKSAGGAAVAKAA